MAVTVKNYVPPPDTLSPNVAIAAPTDGMVVGGRSMSVAVSASDNVGVTKVDLYTDGKFYATSTSATPVFNWITSKLKRGKHTLHGVAYDAAGNVKRSTVVNVYK